MCIYVLFLIYKYVSCEFFVCLLVRVSFSAIGAYVLRSMSQRQWLFSMSILFCFSVSLLCGHQFVFVSVFVFVYQAYDSSYVSLCICLFGCVFRSGVLVFRGCAVGSKFHVPGSHIPVLLLISRFRTGQSVIETKMVLFLEKVCFTAC